MSCSSNALDMDKIPSIARAAMTANGIRAVYSHNLIMLVATSNAIMTMTSVMADIFSLRKNMTLPFHEEAFTQSKGHFLPLKTNFEQKANIYISIIE